mgnify:CR=1 FL=1
MFTAAQRKKAYSPAARRKAVATMKRNRALKQKALKGKGSTVFNITDLPAERPKAKYGTGKRAGAGAAVARIQLARDVIALVSQLLK